MISDLKQYLEGKLRKQVEKLEDKLRKKKLKNCKAVMQCLNTSE